MYRRLYNGLVLLLVVLMLAGCSFREDKNVYDVVVVQSYSQDFPLYPKCEKLLSKIFQDEGLDVRIHSLYLNSEDNSEEENKTRMQLLIDSCSWWNPAAILAFDDEATKALLQTNSNVAYNTPIIFAGVNYPVWPLVDKHSNVTGFVSTPEYMKVADMGNELFHPHNVSFWINQSQEGKEHTHILLHELKYGRHIFRICNSERSMHYRLITEEQFAFEPDSSADAVDYANKHYEPGKPNIVLLDFTRETSADLQGVLFGKIRSNVFVTSQRIGHAQKFALLASSPTLTTISEGFGVGDGILGGYFTPAETEWSSAAKLAVDVIKGADISTMQVRLLKKEYWIDYRLLSRWNLDRKDLPSYCHIANVPFYVKYHLPLLICSCSLLFIIVISFLFLLFLYRKEKFRRLTVMKQVKDDEKIRDLAMRGSKVYAFRLENNTLIFDNDFCCVYGDSFRNMSSYDFMNLIERPFWYLFRKDMELMNIGTLNRSVRHLRLNLTGKGFEWWEVRFNYSLYNKSLSGVLFNIQQTKRVEEELRLSREKVVELERMKSSFLTNMSHEIRTPLNAIIGFSNIIADDENGELTVEQKQKFKQLINENNELLLKLFNDILDLSLIIGGKMTLSIGTCNLNELLLGLYNQYCSLMKEGVELLCHLPDKSIIIHTDVKRLTQVIRNILNNARKFTHKGHILMACVLGPEEGQVSVSIEDTGIGITKDLQNVIFRSFTKLDKFEPGMGMGLAISQNIIERMGGTISLKSTVNAGSCFTITVPLDISGEAANPVLP